MLKLSREHFGDHNGRLWGSKLGIFSNGLALDTLGDDFDKGRVSQFESFIKRKKRLIVICNLYDEKLEGLV